jgi:hypothetical protein
MPIVIGATSTAAGGSPLGHNVVAGTNFLLWRWSGAQNPALGPPAALVSASWGGQALSRLQSSTHVNGLRCEWWGRANPTAGAGNVTWVGGAATESTGATNLSGVYLLGTGNQQSASGFGTVGTVSVVAAAGEVVFDVIAVQNATAIAMGGGQTLQYNTRNAAGFGVTGAGSSEPGPGNIAMSWSWIFGGNQGWCSAAVALQPIRRRTLAHMGVGR